MDRRIKWRVKNQAKERKSLVDHSLDLTQYLKNHLQQAEQESTDEANIDKHSTDRNILEP